ncbi:hypothetical protein QBC32DRAFT_198879, partial [Pseudoneurospora amorphoporcata]
QLQLLESGEHEGQCRKQAAYSIEHYRACGYSGERERQQQQSGVGPSWQHSSGPFRCILGGFGSGLARGWNRSSHVSRVVNELSRIAPHLPRGNM